MTRRGFCQQCGNFCRVDAQESLCRPCSFPVGTCVKCSHLGKIYADGLCYCCYQDRQVRAKIDEVAEKFAPKTEYNRHLFHLYTTYIKRYRLNYFHRQQARSLVKILENDAWSTIRCWHDVYLLSSRYRLAHPNGTDNGCAVKKIGFMLQELGILTIKGEDRSFGIAAILNQFEVTIRSDVAVFVAWLQKANRAEKTVYKNLAHLSRYVQWLRTVYPQLHPYQVAEAKVVEHLESMRVRGNAISQVRESLLTLRRFFAWLVYQKRISVNPCRQLRVARLHAKINIISAHDYRRLKAYIEDSDSPSEDALILTLFLFFGLRSEDTIHATIEKYGAEDFHIVLRQSPRTCGRHHYHRDPILKLPNQPPWLAQLKIRFLGDWSKAYAATVQTYPTQRLLLPRHRHYSRPISDRTLIKRVYHATTQATGKPIPPKILRQTCGHIHARAGDAGLLTVLGWAPYSAFSYTWLPRQEFFAPVPSSKT